MEDQQKPRVELWYCGEWTSWGLTYYDAEDEQQGDTEWHYRKDEAKDAAPRFARRMQKEHGLPERPEVIVFTKNWERQKETL